MPYMSTTVANNILSRTFRDNILVTPMKLQKILYFTASEYAKKTGRALLADSFQTWAYGPVVSPVYAEFRPFSKQNITRYSKDAVGKSVVVDERSDPALQAALDTVWDATKHRTAVDLSNITHLEGSAWDQAFQKEDPRLDNDAIREDRTYCGPLNLPMSVGHP
ncbi:Panacea domain-containing protein [Corynebacterium sp.]|uniref:Panacea domain-containing protein n=1 Tax=Corynebacterium sp. TaxID=1720 RepID=UPI0025BB3657|nr:type II toxin-antitoxin system antitoxin SocA domain-containing protein [Corynebacterium sp.]